MVTLRLQDNGIETVPIGIRAGMIGDLQILNLKEKPVYRDIHTLTMYLSGINQSAWYQYMLDLEPKRIIFNPGSENPEFYQKLDEHGIDYHEACTLVMLASGIYQLA
jgi:hypothetical protein